PEVVHDRRYYSQEARDGGNAQLRLHSQQNACSAPDQHESRCGDGHLRHGNILRLGVCGKRLALLQMVNAVIEKETAKDQPADQEWNLHVSFASRNALDHHIWIRRRERGWPAAVVALVVLIATIGFRGYKFQISNFKFKISSL